jgi:hypothetical protein
MLEKLSNFFILKNKINLYKKLKKYYIQMEVLHGEEERQLPLSIFLLKKIQFGSH